MRPSKDLFQIAPEVFALFAEYSHIRANRKIRYSQLRIAGLFRSAFDQLTNKTSYTIWGFSRKIEFNHWVVIWVQVCDSGAKILCWVRKLRWYGLVAPDFRRQVRFRRLGLLLVIARRQHIFELGFRIYAKLGVWMVVGGPFGLSCVDLRFIKRFRGEPSVKPTVPWAENVKN